jgi:2-keto-3-deoxy-L-rhamnonate aldolase RhmA
VDTAEQARAVVKAAKFPPLGNRSYGGRRPVDRAGRGYADTANSDTLLVVQIESPQAIDNVEAIAAVEGVDALFLGPDDIMLRRGYAMNAPRNRETLGADMEAVASASHRHNKFCITLGMGSEMLQLCLEMGFDLIVITGDVPLLANGSQQAAQAARSAIVNRTQKDDDSASTQESSPY